MAGRIEDRNILLEDATAFESLIRIRDRAK